MCEEFTPRESPQWSIYNAIFFCSFNLSLNAKKDTQTQLKQKCELKKKQKTKKTYESYHQ